MVSLGCWEEAGSSTEKPAHVTVSWVLLSVIVSLLACLLAELALLSLLCYACLLAELALLCFARGNPLGGPAGEPWPRWRARGTRNPSEDFPLVLNPIPKK